MSGIFQKLSMRSPDFSTVIDLLRDRAECEPDRQIYTFLSDGEIISGSLTCQQLDRQAKAIAAQLQSMVAPGSRALVIYPYSASLEFIKAFFGCLYAGVIAVTDNPPRNRQNLCQLQKRIESSQANIILTTKDFFNRIQSQLQLIPTLAATLRNIPWITTDEIPQSQAENWIEPPLNSDSIAFLQYTSGSTGIPKGVAIAHGNILHNCAVITDAFSTTSESRGLVWLPLFHDLGLIGGVMQPLSAQFPVFLMSPLEFIQQPFRWLQAISRHQITVSGGPNFTYDLLCEKVTPQQKETLDLRGWKVAFTGAEPIRAKTLERFSKTFGTCGFHPEAFYPCYGMAETTLMVSGGKNKYLPAIAHLDRAELAKNRVVTREKNHKQGETKAVVGCGKVGLGIEIKIVDTGTLTEASAGEIGEIWVAGESVGKGYWNNPQETAKTFQVSLANYPEERFLRTGDLGFLHEEQLFITGRLKEMMILWGRNHYPHQIEETVEKSHPALRANCGAAFAVEIDGEERLVIAYEIERNYRQNLEGNAIISAIRQAVMEQHLAEIYEVILLKSGSIPKTTSGKIQRKFCKEKFLADSFDPVWRWQSQSSPGSDLELLNLPSK
ncbi:MAG: fatty acyl-AMP ligase [Oscillatoria sp. PMC 1051.18]|nr:fatty acyl-AMP ligase [Oscillatoria sp. PMC 1050.18]MEC5031957.1 fatty acyl-AMP ligase [Oscillatoria sp. PMC 1051.18]